MTSDDQLKRDFNQVDKDNDGSITVDELREYYLPMRKMLGITPELAEQEIQGSLERLDIDENGKISFEGKE